MWILAVNEELESVWFGFDVAKYVEPHRLERI